MAIDWNGHPPLPLYRVRLRRRVRKLLEHHPHLYITATSDGTHSTTSFHYRKRAVDFGSNDPQNDPEKKAMVTCRRLWGYNWSELLGPLDWHAFYGHRYGGMYPGHGDHLHIAL